MSLANFFTKTCPAISGINFTDVIGANTCSIYDTRNDKVSFTDDNEHSKTITPIQEEHPGFILGKLLRKLYEYLKNKYQSMVKKKTEYKETWLHQFGYSPGQYDSINALSDKGIIKKCKHALDEGIQSKGRGGLIELHLLVSHERYCKIPYKLKKSFFEEGIRSCRRARGRFASNGGLFGIGSRANGDKEVCAYKAGLYAEESWTGYFKSFLYPNNYFYKDDFQTGRMDARRSKGINCKKVT